MDAKTMLDRAIKIIARKDVDRELLLFFMNSARKGVLRDREITKFYQYIKSITHTDGLINLSSFTGDCGDFGTVNVSIDYGGFLDTTLKTDLLKIKNIKVVEWDNNGNVKELTKLWYNDAREKYPDFTRTGDPEHYIEIGKTIQVLPVLTAGSINIVAEIWPDDLVDSVLSTDITTEEIPEAWVYLAAAEYLDYFDETEKGSYFRQKGMYLIDQYVIETDSQYTSGMNPAVDGCY